MARQIPHGAPLTLIEAVMGIVIVVEVATVIFFCFFSHLLTTTVYIAGMSAMGTTIILVLALLPIRK